MIEYSTEGEKLICKFLKHMDTETCQKYQEELFEKIALAKNSMFDLRDVDYVSSLFLTFCIRASKVLGSDNLVIVNLHPNVKKVFKISGLDILLRVE